MRKIKYILNAVLVISLILLVNHFKVFDGLSPSDIKEYVMSFGIYAPIIYIILFTVVPLTLFPDSILAIASGMIFGLLGGFVFTMIGALCGASLAFYLARYLGKGILKPLTNRLEGVNKKIKANGFMVIFLLRLIPLFPFDVISYSAGLSDVKYRDYILATMVGTIPGIFVFTNIGDKALQVGSKPFYLSLAFLLALLVGSVVLKKKLSLKSYD